jgi:hypothetical protein
LIVVAGCSRQSRFLTGGPTVGQLKTSLSNLEYENQQLKRASAKLHQENRTMEDRLVQEEIENGDLAARLDDARNLLRDRGLDSEVLVRSHHGRGRSASTPDEFENALEARAPRNAPAPGRRRPPFAQISAPTDPVPPMRDDDAPATPLRDRPGSRARRRVDDDRHSSYNGSLRWLPVAEATDLSASGLR